MSSISYAFAGNTGCFQQPNGQWHCINGKLIGIGRTKTIALHRLNSQLHPVHHHTVNSITLPKKTTHHHLTVRHHHTSTHPQNFVNTNQNTVIKSHGPIKNKGNNFIVTKNVNGKTTVVTNHPENLHIKSNHPVTIIKKSPPPPDVSDPVGGALKGLTDAANSTGKFIGDSLGINKPTNPSSPLPTKRHHFHHTHHPQTTPFTAPPNDSQHTLDRQPIHSGKLGDVAPDTPNKLAVQRALDNQGGITDLGAPDTSTSDPLTTPSSPPSSPSPSPPPSSSSDSPPSQDLSVNSADNTAPPGTSPIDSGNSSVIILGGLILLGLIVVLI